MPLRSFTLSLLGVLAASAAGAAELTVVDLQDDTSIIALTGDIANGNADAVEALMKTANDAGRLISALRLDSPGGSLTESIQLADLIRRAKLPTIVAGGSRCASACFIVFAAGIEKFASYDAAIGVHGASDKFGHETARTEAATLAMARIAGTYGVPPRVTGQMIATSAQSISWLTPADLRAMGAIMTGRVGRLPPTSKPSRGIDAPPSTASRTHD